MSTPKEDLTRLIESQPDDASPDEIVRELAFHLMIQRGLLGGAQCPSWPTAQLGR